MNLEEFNDESFNVTLEGAKGMSHEAIAQVCFKLKDKAGIDMRHVKQLIFDQAKGCVGIVFDNGAEAIVPDIIEVPNRRKVFLPGLKGLFPGLH